MACFRRHEHPQDRKGQESRKYWYYKSSAMAFVEGHKPGHCVRVRPADWCLEAVCASRLAHNSSGPPQNSTAAAARWWQPLHAGMTRPSMLRTRVAPPQRSPACASRRPPHGPAARCWPQTARARPSRRRARGLRGETRRGGGVEGRDSEAQEKPRNGGPASQLRPARVAATRCACDPSKQA
jgi:hypothetical protein